MGRARGGDRLCTGTDGAVRLEGAQMKINWKVRIKNPLWWVQIAAALVLPVLAYFGLA